MSNILLKISFVWFVSIQLSWAQKLELKLLKAHAAELIGEDPEGQMIKQSHAWLPLVEIRHEQLPKGFVKVMVKYKGGPIQMKKVDGSKQEGLKWAYASSENWIWSELYRGWSHEVEDRLLITRAGKEHPETYVGEVKIEVDEEHLSSAPGWALANWMERRKAFHKEEALKPDLVFLGDSITRGLDVSTHLTALDAINQGISGDLSQNMLVRMKEDIIPLNPRGIVVLAGTNDLKDGHSSVDVAARLFAIVDEARLKTRQTKIILCTLMPRENLEENNRVKRLNQILKNKSKERPWLTLCDVYPHMTDLKGSANQAYFPDGVHPNEQGYRVWMKSLSPLIQL